MGGKSRQEVEITIRNEINLSVSNYNKTTNKLLNDTATSVAMQLINETVNNTAIKTAGANVFKVDGGIKLSGKSKFSVNQKVDVRATNEAVFKLMTDLKLLQTLGTKITDEVVSKIKNDNAVQQSLAAANELNNAIKNAGGPEGMLASAMKAFDSIAGSLTGKTTESEVRQTIENKLNLNISNTTINETDVRTMVKNSVDTMIKNITENKCDIQNSATNEVVISGGVEMSDEAEFPINQVANVVALNKCLFDQINKTDLTTKLNTDLSSAATTDVENKNRVTQSASLSNKGSNIDSQDSVIAQFLEMLKQLGGIVIIVVLIIVVVIIFVLLKTGSSVLGLAGAGLSGFGGLAGVGGIGAPMGFSGVVNILDKISVRALLGRNTINLASGLSGVPALSGLSGIAAGFLKR